MAWTWINDLLAPEGKKKSFNWDARCPYHLCPSNQPYRRAHKSRLKFMQRISPLVYQYRCRDCGCLCNIGVEVPDDRGIWNLKKLNPVLHGGKPDYKFR